MLHIIGGNMANIIEDFALFFFAGAVTGALTWGFANMLIAADADEECWRLTRQYEMGYINRPPEC